MVWLTLAIFFTGWQAINIIIYSDIVKDTDEKIPVGWGPGVLALIFWILYFIG